MRIGSWEGIAISLDSVTALPTIGPCLAHDTAARLPITMAELEIKRDERVAWLTLNRPAARNSLSPKLLEELLEACAALQDDLSIRVVVLSGAGGVFSAGADLMGFMASMHGADPEQAADVGRLAAEALLALPQVTIAAIEGHCVGGGLVLAACCDLRWAQAEAWFSAPELDLGVPLAWGGMQRLVDLLGDTMASELVLTCRRLTSEEALVHGLISRRIEDDFQAQVEDTVEQIAERPGPVFWSPKGSCKEFAQAILMAARMRQRYSPLCAIPKASEPRRDTSRAVLPVQHRRKQATR